MESVIVQGVFVVDPDQRDRFLEASMAGMAASRAEEGCLEYVFAADPLDAGRVVLSERWESMDLLRQHLTALQSRPAAPRPQASSSEIVIYEVVSATRLV